MEAIVKIGSCEAESNFFGSKNLQNNSGSYSNYYESITMNLGLNKIGFSLL